MSHRYCVFAKSLIGCIRGRRGLREQYKYDSWHRMGHCTLHAGQLPDHSTRPPSDLTPKRRFGQGRRI